jgi:hypothetical protein
MSDFLHITVGSIVSLTAPGGRAMDGEPCTIPAIVLGQFPDDGTLRLFCFHFEGQFHQMTKPGDVQVLFDAGDREPNGDEALESLIVLRDDFATLQRQMAEFQEEVLGMIVGQPSTLPAAPPAAPPTPAETPVVAPALDELPDPGVATTRRRR